MDSQELPFVLGRVFITMPYYLISGKQRFTVLFIQLRVVPGMAKRPLVWAHCELEDTQ